MAYRNNNVQHDLYGLSIQILSFNLGFQKYAEDGNIRISLTTLPDHIKQHFIFDENKINNKTHIFTVNVYLPQAESDWSVDSEQKILICFRHKNLFKNDPLLGSAIIHDRDFFQLQTETSSQTSVQIFDIYEPIHDQIKKIMKAEKYGQKYPLHRTNRNTIERDKIGNVEIKMTLHEPYIDKRSCVPSNHHAHNKKINEKSAAKEFKDMKGDYYQIQEDPYICIV